MVEDVNSRDIILFDGLCSFCSSLVHYIIAHDPSNKMCFASLQSEFALSLLLDNKYTGNTNTIIFIKNNKIYKKSRAVLEIALQLNKLWPLAYLFIVIPAFIRDFLYDLIAKNRYRWFGKKESCMIPGEEIKARFVDL